MNHRKIKGKIIIAGELECLTGLHIGASKENMEIGALDSPVVRDPITRRPYLPGSSLQGKLRALLEQATPECQPNRNGGTRARPVWRCKGTSREPRAGPLRCQPGVSGWSAGMAAHSAGCWRRPYQRGRSLRYQGRKTSRKLMKATEASSDFSV